MLTQVERVSSLIARVEFEVQNAAHGRVRDLTVEDLGGCVIVRGSVPTHHTKQQALQALMNLVSAGRFRAHISVRPPLREQDSSEMMAKAY